MTPVSEPGSIDSRDERRSRVDQADNDGGSAVGWTRRDQAVPLLVETTINLLKTRPFPEATVRRISAEAGLNPSSLQRNFGSMAGLFDAVANELLARSAARMLSGPEFDVVALEDEDAVLRTRLVAWLLAEGVDPASLNTPVDNPVREAIRDRQNLDESLSPRTVDTFLELVTFLSEGFITFSPVHPGADAQRLADGVALMNVFREHLKEFEAELGWTEAPES